jgi:hypothetical protein|tara:strand:- start:248 stop:463 length:216 start_codon:yes stop_codon:yes gene_type:complete
MNKMTEALLQLARELRDVDAQLDLLTIRSIEGQGRDIAAQSAHRDLVRDRMFRQAGESGVNLLPVRAFFYS